MYEYQRCISLNSIWRARILVVDVGTNFIYASDGHVAF